ncbi:MAG: EAL domain-containing protein [Lachnospiraceae bacterium]|nr:EAL domain-containing protein [Lachnospiraceae bacterium]
MEYILCSANFKTFFNLLQGNIFTAEEIAQKLKTAIPCIADDIHLGRLALYLDLPADMYQETDIRNCLELYISPSGYEDNVQIEHFETGNHGSVQVALYPVKGHIFTEAEQEAGSFLAQNVFVFCSKARLTELMKKASTTDALTGASNMNGLMQFGGMLKARNWLSHYNGAFLNLKNFKYINQRVGAAHGDEILKAYCSSIRDQLSDDEFFARLGGDNFLVLIRKEHFDIFLDFVSHITIPCNVQGKNREFDIISRMGIFDIGPEHTMADVMTGTSIALNIAKQAGTPDYIWFRPDMMDTAIHDKKISVLFPQAIENKEFLVFYQPKVSLSDNTLCGCEALVRWVRNGTLIPPSDFIPVLEQEGSICKLDFYVFDVVCRNIKEWLDEGIEPVKVSVNFSKLHLNNPHLAEDIISVMNTYQISSKYIEIELTETSGYENYEEMSQFVNRMKEYGIGTSIDDFGTGYSSLNLLKDLNVDIIKLDKSFLNTLGDTDASDKIVIKNIVNMVNELDMKVIAEGVETEAQMSFLKSVNCSMVQGYLFDKPLPHHEFNKRLSEGRIYKK